MESRQLSGRAVAPWGARRVALAVALAFGGGVMPLTALAQSVAMTGGMGSKALLVVNGGAPKALAAGDTYQGVKVLSVSADQAAVEVAGKRQTVHLGEAPVSIGGSGGGANGTQIVLSAVSGGHFVTQGQVNGKSTSFMVDTGATSVAMGADEARRMGIKFEDGAKFYGSTANGTVVGYRVSLTSVRIQDVEVFNVEAAVLPMPMPHILLGNSFLTRFQMKRDNDTLTLTKRY
ncbi:TIGR02281 family clan AA aspartic protease [Aquabacterium sp. NJ1]|uniref:retropepsin-like aspartic protease family protein n=1 Tax=Aquabacterium sp. NJ1 TaxID=1538295 RepID=UPI0009E059F2|nr:retropepsin-like aspartic protease [Aquabacterium sp. NJ1]